MVTRSVAIGCSQEENLKHIFSVGPLWQRLLTAPTSVTWKSRRVFLVAKNLRKGDTKMAVRVVGYICLSMAQTSTRTCAWSCARRRTGSVLIGHKVVDVPSATRCVTCVSSKFFVESRTGTPALMEGRQTCYHPHC